MLLYDIAIDDGIGVFSSDFSKVGSYSHSPCYAIYILITYFLYLISRHRLLCWISSNIFTVFLYFEGTDKRASILHEKLLACHSLTMLLNV